MLAIKVCLILASSHLILFPYFILLDHFSFSAVTFFSLFPLFVACILYLIQNSQAVKKECGPQKGYSEKRCEIQGGSQEMAVMVG